MEDRKFSKDSSTSLHIGGINVRFPVKPYPSQLSMMSMIIKGLQKGQHCLLESPTGSGKSLALLCSALAWQQAQYRKLQAEHPGLKAECEEIHPCTCQNSTVLKEEVTASRYFGDSGACNANSVINVCSSDEEYEDFKRTGKSTAQNNRKHKEPTTCDSCTCQEKSCSLEEKELRKPKRVPKIWFGTRTHRQIAQITKELGRTWYKTANMTILSSRQHSCIHPAVVKSSNKNEECRDLRRGTHALGVKCAFYLNVRRMKNHHQLLCAGMESAWDLEDLVGLGKNIKSCPFYSARELVATSDIIFCPYNYLIDPMIRNQMQINLNNQIIIFDEAHNIEDGAREAGSFTLDEDLLANTTCDLECLINDGVKLDDHRPLHLLCTRLGQWISEHVRSLRTSDYEVMSEVWCGKSIITHLKEWGISQDTLPLLKGNFNMATDLGEEDVETAKLMHSSSQATLEGLFNVLSYLMNDDYKHCDDYRITITRHSVFGILPPKRTRDGWVTLQKKPKKHFVTNLHFWCLNPAVAFNDLRKAHCIILTSGTLSPMSSFSSELGLSFPIQLEANHVIQNSQVWVGSVGRGPKGIQLEATYKNTDRFEFQDELGNLVCEVCHTVPHGVLCFFSSYSMMQKLQERWKITGLWPKIERLKVVVCEPRSSSKDEFDSTLQLFYDAVKESETSGLPTGALFLAVCRGKVSEGLDFADNNARAVITVGIPFPSIKDKKVELKRKYNDMHKNQRGLLSGGQWYEIQAFRAMNQALGRCIRHRNDWGALIIVDERFTKNPKKYALPLSKWVRQKMMPFQSYGAAISSVDAFVQDRTSKHGAPAAKNVDPLEKDIDAQLHALINTPHASSSSLADKDELREIATSCDADAINQTADFLLSANSQQLKPSECPATPERSELTIIPESPESTKKEPLQHATVKNVNICQSLEFSVRSDVAKLSAKRKDAPLPTYRERDFSDLPPRAKRRTRQKILKKTNFPMLEDTLECKTCTNLFVIAGTPLLKAEIESSYLTSLINQKEGCKCNVYAADTVVPGSVSIISVGVDGVGTELNSYWSGEDRKCYQVFKCSNCSVITGTRIVSEPTMEKRHLFFTDLVSLK